MTPRFDLFRKLYARIAAKPEALVQLNRFRSPAVSCGTPFCVLGELCEMPEARNMGFEWQEDDFWTFLPRFRLGSLGSFGIGFDGFNALGITEEEAGRLFGVRDNYNIPEKQEALDRIEALFTAHNELLHIVEPVAQPIREVA